MRVPNRPHELDESPKKVRQYVANLEAVLADQQAQIENLARTAMADENHPKGRLISFVTNMYRDDAPLTRVEETITIRPNHRTEFQVRWSDMYDALIVSDRSRTKGDMATRPMGTDKVGLFRINAHR